MAQRRKKRRGKKRPKNAYTVRIQKAAQKDIDKLGASQTDLESIRDAVLALGRDPRPTGFRALGRMDGLPACRIRVGDYRVCYTINGRKLLVLVVAVGDRKEVYAILARRFPGRLK